MNSTRGHHLSRAGFLEALIHSKRRTHHQYAACSGETFIRQTLLLLQSYNR